MSFQLQTYINSQQAPFYVPIYYNSCVYIKTPELYPISNENSLKMTSSFMFNIYGYKSNQNQKIDWQSVQCQQKRKNLENKTQISASGKESCYNLKNKESQNQKLEKQIECSRIQTKREKLIREIDQLEVFQDLAQIGKTNWTNEEQQKLKQLVNLFGKRWKYISQYFPNRTGKQIRERYLNYLRPNLSLKKWSQEEDNNIMQLVEKYGRSWRTIEKKLKNRSQNQIKNRYYGHLQKIQKSAKCQQIVQTQGGLKRQDTRSETLIPLQAKASQ